MAAELTLSTLRDLIVGPIRKALIDFHLSNSGSEQDAIPEVRGVLKSVAVELSSAGHRCEREVSYGQWNPHSNQSFDWVIGNQPRTPVEFKVVRDHSPLWDFWGDVQKVSSCRPDRAESRARPVCVGLISEKSSKDAEQLKSEIVALRDQKFPNVELEFSDPWRGGKDWNWFLALARHGP